MVLFGNQHFTKEEDTLFLVDRFADTHLLVEVDNTRIPVHKVILANASPVFKAIFYGEMKE